MVPVLHSPVVVGRFVDHLGQPWGFVANELGSLVGQNSAQNPQWDTISWLLDRIEQEAGSAKMKCEFSLVMRAGKRQETTQVGLFKTNCDKRLRIVRILPI